ncbi:hypothetical protein D3C76_93830 [compost metagenome]
MLLMKGLLKVRSVREANHQRDIFNAIFLCEKKMLGPLEVYFGQAFGLGFTGCLLNLLIKCEGLWWT